MLVEAPAFASELRVDVSYLEARVGAGLAANRAFSVDGNQVVLPGEDTEFFPFAPVGEPTFSFGSFGSLRLVDRPIWIGVVRNGLDLVLDLDDGDSTGQDLYIAKEWLRAEGMHRPVAMHEDGYELTVRDSSDHRGFIVEIPHFTQVILTPADIDVKGRQGGAPFQHAGLITWDGTDQELRIDIGPKLDDDEVLVERDWFELNMPHPALYDYSWVVENVSGAYYYAVTVPQEDTPTTVVFEQFAFGLGQAFGLGSGDLLSVALPSTFNASIDREMVLVDFETPTGSLSALSLNSSLLKDARIHNPRITTNVGDIDAWSVSAAGTLQLTLNQQTVSMMIANSTDPDAPGHPAMRHQPATHSETAAPQPTHHRSSPRRPCHSTYHPSPSAQTCHSRATETTALPFVLTTFWGYRSS